MDILMRSIVNKQIMLIKSILGIGGWAYTLNENYFVCLRFVL